MLFKGSTLGSDLFQNQLDKVLLIPSKNDM